RAGLGRDQADQPIGVMPCARIGSCRASLDVEQRTGGSLTMDLDRGRIEMQTATDIHQCQVVRAEPAIASARADRGPLGLDDGCELADGPAWHPRDHALRLLR